MTEASLLLRRSGTVANEDDLDDSTAASPEDSPSGASPPPPGPGLAAPPLPGITRRRLAFAVAALAVTWLLIVFARAVADSAAITERAAALRAENAALERELAAGRRELALIREDRFVRLESRAYAMGEPGERVFSLRAGAPPPAPITPLGSNSVDVSATTPLDDWLALLFGP